MTNTIQGTNGDDFLEWVPGDNLITTGDNPGFDQVVGSAGNDTIDFSGVTSDPGEFVSVDYRGIDVTIDGGANTGSVVKGGLGIRQITDYRSGSDRIFDFTTGADVGRGSGGVASGMGECGYADQADLLKRMAADTRLGRRFFNDVSRGSDQPCHQII